MVRYFLAWFEIIHIKQTWDEHRGNDISDHSFIFQRQVDNNLLCPISGKKCHHQNGKFCGVTSMVYSMKRAHSFVVLCFVMVILSTPNNSYDIQYIPRNMHTVFALLCFVVVIHWLIYPYPSGLLHWHCGNLTIAPVPAKQPWWIWINTSCEFIMNDYITTTKQSTTKPCAYFLGYTVQYRAVITPSIISKNSHNRDPIARPWGRYIRYLLWI